MSDAEEILHFEPKDLDGHTIDELTDYLERGGEPADPSIDGSPACQNALRALERLHDLARSYLDDESEPPSGDRGWIAAVEAAIPRDARPGRRFPFRIGGPEVSVNVTEGAIRGLIRAIGDGVPGLLVGSVRLGSDEPVPLSVDVAMIYGVPVADAVAAFRRALLQVLPDHVPFGIGSIDVHVIGVIDPAGPAPSADR